MRTRILRPLIAGAIAALSLSVAHAQESSVLRYAIWSNPNGTFHPTLYFTDYDRAVIFSVYGRLFTLDANQNPLPSLAASFEYSEDGSALTLHLREGVSWHDGEPFTADDVAYTYASEAHPDFPRDHSAFSAALVGFEAYNAGETETLEGIEVIDPLTIRFTFKAPYAAAFSQFADRPILARHVWEKAPIGTWNEATSLLRNPVGTGPYKFVQFLPDQYVELKRNEEYFGGAPKVETFIFKVSNNQTAQTELINGELDIAEISSWNQTDLQTYADNNIDVVERAGPSAQYLTLDSTDERLSDKRVRQAIIHAINRQALVDSLLFGHGSLFNSNAHPQSPYYPDDLNPYEYSPEKARALLAEAGWADSNGDGILDKDGQPFTFTINFPTGNRTRELSAPIIQQNLKAVGIDAELISADFNSTLAILQNPETEFDGVLMGGTFRPGSYSNNHWWERFESPRLTELSDAFNATVDEDERRQLVGDWLREVNEQAVRVWLYIPNEGFAVAPRVTHYASGPYEPFAQINSWTVAE